MKYYFEAKEEREVKEEFLEALQFVVDAIKNDTSKETILDNLEDLKEYGLKL